MFSTLTAPTAAAARCGRAGFVPASPSRRITCWPATGNIEINSVRAQRVAYPRHYRWSSYRANAEGVFSKRIVPHDQYRALGRSEKARREAYRALFRTQLDPEVVRDIRAAINGNYALGSTRFQKEMGTMLSRRGDTG
jgi:putative transposase